MDVTLISRYFDTRNGGAGSYSKSIYEGILENSNYNIKLLSQENSLFPKYNQLSYLFFSSIELKYLLKKELYKNSDIFHALTPLEALYTNKRRTVVSILDFIPLQKIGNESVMSNVFSKYFNKALKKSAECERLITINSDLPNDLEKYYNVDKSIVEVIRPSISIDYYPKEQKNEVYTIGTIANLMKRKRVDILLKSFLEANIPNSKLLIAGRGAELENLKNLANGDDRIEFLGFVPDEKMNDFYNSLDVFVFPTQIEGYGMPIVEAMGCGKPVITLKDSVIPSDIKNRTITCNKEELTNVLKSQNFEYNKKSNIEFYKEHSIEKISEKIIKVYESI